MKVVYYYRTERKDVREAHLSDEMRVARIEATAERFAARFGARPYYTMGFDSHFAGIGFDKEHLCRHPALWTKPTQDNPCVVPRSPERAGALLRPMAEELYKEYHGHLPKDDMEPRASTLLSLLGLTRDDMPKQLMVYHEVAGRAYIATTLTLNHLTDFDEIVASEFVAAQIAAMPTFQPVTEAEALAAIAQGANNGNTTH